MPILKVVRPLWLAALILISAVATAQTKPVAQWEPYSEHGDLYPSFALAVANLADSTSDKEDANIGDPNGIIGIVFTPDRSDTRVVVQLTCASDPKLFSPAMLDVMVPEAGEEYRITPTVLFNPAKLASIKQPITVSITYTVTINGQKQPPLTEPLLIRSINDCPLVVTDNNDESTMDWVLATYVNESHSAVAQVLDEALRKKYVDSFVGYEGAELSIYQQVLAVWRVLQDRGNRYTNLDPNAVGAGPIPVQSIPLLGEPTRPAPANCVDGTVLMASVLRRIGLNPVLVVMPGHFFVGFDLDESGEKQVYLETTLLGVVPDYAAADKQLVSQLGTGATEAAQTAVRSFVAAIEAANQTYAQNQSRIQAEQNGYAAVYLDDVRQAGIGPIPAK